MNLNFRHTLVLFLMLMSIGKFVNAQSEIDSLTAIYDAYIQKNEKSKAAAELLKLYEQTVSSNDIVSLQYAATALQMYSELGDTIHIALCNKLIGDNYFSRDILAMSMDAYSKSMELYALSDKKREQAELATRIGQIFLAQKLSAKAQESYHSAFDLYVSEKDSVGIAEVYELQAKAILIDQEQDDNQALALLDSALIMRIKLKDESLIARSFEAIADAYFFMENYETAGAFLEKALEKYKKIGNLLKQADAYYVFGEKYSIDKQYHKAKQNFEKAYNIYKSSEISEKEGQTANKLATVYLELNDLKTSEQYAQGALHSAKLFDYQKIRLESYEILSKIRHTQHKHAEAYTFLVYHRYLADSIRVEEQNRQSTELQINLATQKKEQEIKFLQQNQKVQSAEIDRNKAQKRGLYIGLLLLGMILILLLIFGYYFYKTTQKTKQANALLLEKNQEINQQKEEIQAQRDRLKGANIAITKQRDEIEAKNEKIEAGMFYASKIQRAMQPKMKEIRGQLPDSFVMLSPKETVSGDFYWYAHITNEEGVEKTIITAVDCTGHGVSGAFMSMLADAYLTQIVLQRKIFHPEIILQELHTGIVSSLQQDKSNNADGMDMALVVIDKKNKTLEFAGAKNPLFYINNGTSDIIKADHESIGGIKRGEERIYTRHTLDISTPTTFYLYTDGFQDQFGGENNKKYMAKRFRDFLEKISQLPTNQQATALAVELDEWKGDRQQMDDILVLGVKIS